MSNIIYSFFCFSQYLKCVFIQHFIDKCLHENLFQYSDICCNILFCSCLFIVTAQIHWFPSQNVNTSFVNQKCIVFFFILSIHWMVSDKLLKLLYFDHLMSVYLPVRISIFRIHYCFLFVCSIKLRMGPCGGHNIGLFFLNNFLW